MRDDNPSSENAPPGRGSEGVPPWQEMGEAWASIMTSWADLTTGWTSFVTAWMRASGSWMGMNPMMGMNPFMGRGEPEAAAEWARQVMECMGRVSRNVQPPTGTGPTPGTTASAAPTRPPV